MDKLLLIDDEVDVHYSFRRIFESSDLEIHTASSGEEGLRVFQQVKPDVVLSDIRLGGASGLDTLGKLRAADARVPVILMTAYGTTQMAIEAMKLGAFDYVLKPFDIARLRTLLASALKASHDMRESVAIRPVLQSDDYQAGIVGRSEAMQSVFKLIGQLATSDATVLITGESGTGKELVARAIYQHGLRSQRPFLAINCAAIPENLLESELFGHEKGAFSGATALRIGKFEQCHGGTVFLDEIGDMTPATQTKVLRILQNGTFERVGGNQTIKADVRIIAATNKNLEEAVAKKEFREDLFYRLNVVRIHLPPLRDRREDIRLLVDYHLRRIGGDKSVTPATMEALQSRAWPGNVRELENVLRRAVVVSKGPHILPSDLPADSVNPPAGGASSGQAIPAGSQASGTPPAEPAKTPLGFPELARQLFQIARHDPSVPILPTVERELVIQALKETSGNQLQAARLLGITRATLRKRVEKFAITRELTIQ